MILTVYILVTLVIIYCISLIFYIIGNLQKVQILQHNQLEPISVIVAVKNGELSLPNILTDLENQDYEGKVEFIIVDDQSIDNSKKIIQEFENKNPQFKYISSTNGNPKLNFKKKAIDAGIKNTNYNILLFTDVDCRLPNTWITSMAKSFNLGVDYVIGVSRVNVNSNNLIALFQKIDLMMLFYVARGMCNLNTPFASIGQNQAYRKKLYQKVGFLDIVESIQGDDTLFLQLCVKHNIKVVFNDNPQSFVSSRIENKFCPFIKQRIRWAADLKVMWNYNKKLFIISLSTFMSNMIILLLFLECFIFKVFNYLDILYLLLLIKLILELLLYLIGSLKLKLKTNLFSFLYWFILEIPYVVFMGFGSFFSTWIGWKQEK